jgi:hypothetical protein
MNIKGKMNFKNNGEAQDRRINQIACDLLIDYGPTVIQKVLWGWAAFLEEDSMDEEECRGCRVHAAYVAGKLDHLADTLFDDFDDQYDQIAEDLGIDLDEEEGNINEHN